MTDIAAIETEARTHPYMGSTTVLALIAELRKERTRADEMQLALESLQEAAILRAGIHASSEQSREAPRRLARAREVIEKTEDWVTAHYLDTSMGESVLEILATYNQKN